MAGNMKKKFDAIIIGAGIIGASIAYYLTIAGKKVLVLEKNEVASGATGACNGGLSYFGKENKELLWAKESLQLYQEIVNDLNSAIELRQGVDMFLISRDEEEEAYIERLIEACHRAELPAEKLSKVETLKRIPYLSRDFLGGAVANGGLHGFVNSIDFTLKMLDFAVNNGGEVRINNRVVGLIEQNRSIIGVKTANGLEYSDVVVNATANAANELVPDQDLGLEPYQGIVLVTEQTPFKLAGNILSANFFKHIENVPNLAIEQTLHNNLLIGSSRKLNGKAKELDYNTVINIAKNALSYLPCLAELQIIRAYAGIRPQRKAGVFLGEDETLKRLFHAIGFSSMGITLAPYAGKTLAKIIIDS